MSKEFKGVVIGVIVFVVVAGLFWTSGVEIERGKALAASIFRALISGIYCGALYTFVIRQ